MRWVSLRQRTFHLRNPGRELLTRHFVPVHLRLQLVNPLQKSPLQDRVVECSYYVRVVVPKASLFVDNLLIAIAIGLNASEPMRVPTLSRGRPPAGSMLP